MPTPLHLLSGGAAQGLVRTLQAGFEARTGAKIEATYGAVGAMKERLMSGAPCDVLILTQALIDELTVKGDVVAGSTRPLGVVQTGLAVKEGAPSPDVTDSAGLRRWLEGASEIYFPDPAKATAGIHFMKVLTALGLAESLAPRLRTFPNGATAMGALAQANDARSVGCTQVTEIIITPGIRLDGLLPPPHQLATTYTGAVCTRAAQPQLAKLLVEALGAGEAAEARRQAGFA